MDGRDCWEPLGMPMAELDRQLRRRDYDLSKP